METKLIGRRLGLLFAAFVMFHSHTSAAATEAAQQVKQTVDRVLAIVNDPALKGDAKAAERRQKLKEVIGARFDFAEMAKRSLGSQWQKRSPAEQKEFVEVFTELLEGSYLDKIESYSGEKVRFVNDRQEKDYAEVGTKISNNKGEEFSVDYRLYNANGDWKVSDVIIENISLVNNYRAQFNRVLARSSYAELLETMKQKKLSAPGTKS
ncbi:MAG TPA: ABC transporter substrate-binding protein [Candidatus Udaeobacter sp.]|nr:ABC transporter substrate-binding protein [Candidatus Udaeobacter sp.]